MSYRFGEFSTIKISYLLPAYSDSLHHFQVSKDHRNLVIHVSHRVQLKPMKMALLGMRRTPCVSTLVKIPSCSLRLQYSRLLARRRLVFFLFLEFFKIFLARCKVNLPQSTTPPTRSPLNFHRAHHHPTDVLQSRKIVSRFFDLAGVGELDLARRSCFPFADLYIVNKRLQNSPLCRSRLEIPCTWRIEFRQGFVSCVAWRDRSAETCTPQR